MLLKDFREPLLSFELIYFRNSFCYKTENSCGFRYKILGHVGSLGKILNILSPLGSLKFWDFTVYTEVIPVKNFLQHFELCLYCKIEEVMKFYNVGDKTFETDFRLL